MLRQLAATTIGQEIRGMIFSHVHDATSFRPQPPRCPNFRPRLIACARLVPWLILPSPRNTLRNLAKVTSLTILFAFKSLTPT